MRSSILLCVIFIYQLTGVSSLRSLSVEDFIDRVLFRTQQNLYRRLTKGWSIFLGTSLKADNGTFIPLGTDNFATGVGVHYKLKRDGECDTKVESSINTLQCPVIFDQFKVILPRFHGDGGKQYILRVVMKVKVVLWNPRGSSFLSYKRFTNTRTTYTMTDSNNVIVIETPARYSLSLKSTRNLRGVMWSRLEDFLTNGDFYHSLTTALSGVPKPSDFHR
uniref:Putative conserved secreted protein n=1 Tax=Ixodes ricinus TaxID=34613 RepID=A0A6B0V2P7_IXORI